MNFYKPVLLAAPAMVAVGYMYAVLPELWGGMLIWTAAGLGALGWGMALLARVPLFLVIRRFTYDARFAQQRVAAISGPSEEIIRLAVLLAVGRDLDTAYSIGLGWAGIEIVYSILNGVLLTTLQTRDDSEAVEARRQLSDLGMLRDFPPVASVVERVTASAFHIGATLLIARWPAVVLSTIVLHSMMNMAFVSLLRRSLIQAQSVVAVVGLPFLIGGLIVMKAL